MSKNKPRSTFVTALIILLPIIMVAAIIGWISLQVQIQEARDLTPLPTATVLSGPTVGYGPLLTPLPSAAQNFPSPTPTVASQPTPTLEAHNNALVERYGLIVTGLTKEPDKIASLQRFLGQSGARWWYQYTTDHPSLPDSKARQVYLVRTWHGGRSSPEFQAWLAFVRANNFAKPSFWMLGNEPNVAGQDDTTPELYAESLHEAAQIIRATDPHATIIGPNLLNWDYTCQGCAGFSSGRDWSVKMRAAYYSRYGQEPPLDAWSIHAYSLDWGHLPMINQSQDAHQLDTLRQDLDSVPATKDKPIWLTEFGVIWGYDGTEWKKDATGNWKLLPQGKFRQDLIEGYLNTSLDWMETNAERLKLAHWFVFTSVGETESFSNTFGGIALFDGASPLAGLTDFGRLYFGRLKQATTLEH